MPRQNGCCVKAHCIANIVIVFCLSLGTTTSGLLLCSLLGYLCGDSVVVVVVVLSS